MVNIDKKDLVNLLSASFVEAFPNTYIPDDYADRLAEKLIPQLESKYTNLKIINKQ